MEEGHIVVMISSVLWTAKGQKFGYCFLALFKAVSMVMLLKYHPADVKKKGAKKIIFQTIGVNHMHRIIFTSKSPKETWNMSHSVCYMERITKYAH